MDDDNVGGYVPACQNMNAAYKQLQNFFRPIKTCPYPDLLRIAAKWTESDYLQYTTGSRIYSLQEVVDTIDMTRSVGPLYSYKDKMHAVEDYAFRLDYQAYTDEMATTGDPFSLMAVFLKDELINHKKVADGKTRLIWSQSVLNFLLLSQFVLDANRKIKKHRLPLGHTIGTSRFGREWHETLSKFESLMVMFLDASRFDASHPMSTLASMWRIYWKSLDLSYRTPRNFVILLNLMRVEHFGFAVLPNGVLFRRDGRNPSGSAITIQRNTIFNQTIQYYVFLRIYNPTDCPDNYNVARQVLTSILQGDDSIVAWHKRFKSFVDYLDVYNEACTFTSTVDDWKLIDEAVYCSQRIERKMGLLMPIPNTSRMLSGLLIHKGRSLAQSLVIACAIRIHAYFNEPIRRLVTGYFQEQIVNLSALDAPLVMSCFLTDTQIEKLYTQHENGFACKDNSIYLRCPQTLKQQLQLLLHDVAEGGIK